MPRPRCPNCDVDIRDCKCITLFGDKASDMAERKPKPKTWSRKGNCPGCGVGTRSKHKESCTFDYEKETTEGSTSILERVPQNKLFMCIGMFDAETKVGRESVKIDVAMSGATLIIEVEPKKWRKENPGDISPYRYELTPEALCNLVLEEYQKHVAEEKQNAGGKKK